VCINNGNKKYHIHASQTVMSISERKQKVPEDLRHKLEQTVASTEEQVLESCKAMLTSE
jgi:hypothetical protein